MLHVRLAQEILFLNMKQEEPGFEVARHLGMVWREQHAPAIEELAARINELIAKDFQQLISILYRMDINELKLRSLLETNPGEDAAGIIAAMMIERQLQKIKSRRESQQDDNISDEEKW